MKTHLLVLVLFFCSIQMFHSQENDGVVALNLPLRNSLTFNRFTINPTFSFVREQNKYISISNKREWVQFEDAPLTYLASYSGRFGENVGLGIGAFQQNYGVLTTFGGLVNFSYNARLARDSNLTFGLNIGVYKSGLNSSSAVTNIDDPSIENVPENFLITVNPGINYGNGFFDFGVSLKNILAYNLKSSMLVEDNPEKGLQGHVMYTGYISSRGFFDESVFTTLVRSEFRKDETITSAMVMLSIPKGLWAQAGYNSVYGVSGGIGINISPQIAVEYNFEKALGDLTTFETSHEISLAYRFKNTENYEYSSGDEVSSLFTPSKRKRKRRKNKKLQDDNKVIAEQQAKEAADAQTKLLAEQQAKEATDAQAKLLAEQQEKEAADARAELLAEQQAKEAADAQAKLLAEQQSKEAADAQTKLLAEQQAKEATDAQAKLLAEQQEKEAADARAELLAEQQAKEATDAQAKLLAEQQAKEAEDVRAELLAEQQAKEAADAQAKFLAEQRAKDDSILNPIDKKGKTMLAITLQIEESKTTQSQLLQKLDEIIEIKNKDLKDLKEENDLSEKGIAVKPKPFKSITEENNALKAIKADLENIINTRNEKIKVLKELNDDTIETETVVLDGVTLYYKKTIKRLEEEQKQALETKNRLDKRLKEIEISTEYERRRRIKRAAFDNEDERYTQDRATLKNIKETNVSTTTTPTSDDFDFGKKQSDNIKILEQVKNEESGYYLVLAVHNDVNKRNEFLTKVVQSGRADVDFFYDVNSSKYYIYDAKFDSIQAANKALNAKGNKPYNINMSIVKIEN